MAPINRVAPRAGHQQGSPLPDNVRRPSDLSFSLKMLDCK